MLYQGYEFDREPRKLWPIAYRIPPTAPFELQIKLLQDELEQALENGDNEYANVLREVIEDEI